MKYLYLSIISFVFISTFSLSLSRLVYLKKIAGSAPKQQIVEAKSYPGVPILKIDAVPPVVAAESVFAVDIDSGVGLYEKNPDEQLLPASTTKIMTALTALDFYNLDSVLTVGKIRVAGQKMRLVEGEKMSVRNLILGLLVYSANDAAEVLAQNYPGGRGEFVNAMNEKAKGLHLKSTYFVNPSGLDGNGLLTTARDLFYLAQVAIQDPFLREVVGTKEVSVSSEDGLIKHKLVNINELVGEVPGVLGIKTGWTENAKENLVTYVERDGKKVIIVLLKSNDRFGETKTLIDWVFNSYEWKSVRI